MNAGYKNIDPLIVTHEGVVASVAEVRARLYAIYNRMVLVHANMLHPRRRCRSHPLPCDNTARPSNVDLGSKAAQATRQPEISKATVESVDRVGSCIIRTSPTTLAPKSPAHNAATQRPWRSTLRPGCQDQRKASLMTLERTCQD